MMTIRTFGLSPLLPVVLASALGAGCANRPPTIAHTHIGHTVTAVHVTPGKKGYLEVAEARAAGARELATQASAARSDLSLIQERVAAIADKTSSPDQFGLQQAIIQATNHLTFAATSADASPNLKEFAPRFATSIAGIIERCELIELLADDVAATDSLEEARFLSAEIERLTEANAVGEDVDGDGVKGNTPAGYGVAQLRNRIEAMLAREDPPYTVADTWYLFNLVRLPNGLWVWDKLGRGGNIEGYK